ncbi:Glutamate decarboxylase 2 [Rhizina undulata]
MPKEAKKRGRRAEKKRNEEKNEAVAEAMDIDVPQEHQASWDESYAEGGRGEETQFYGLLNEEEQEYFRRADEMLELNSFNDAEERALFIANVYRESEGKELKIANSQGCSRLLEKLLLLSTPSQLKTLFQKFSGQYVFSLQYILLPNILGFWECPDCGRTGVLTGDVFADYSFLNLVQHRFASHCCEMLFTQAAGVVTKELDPKYVSQDQISNDEIFASMESLFLYMLNELEPQLKPLLSDRFASHTLRILLLILSGEPIASSAALVQSKKKEKISISSEIPTDPATTEKREVPQSFHDAVGKILAATSGSLSVEEIRAMAVHQIGSPTLQVLLQLEMGRSNAERKARAKSVEGTLLGKLTGMSEEAEETEEKMEDGSNNSSFFQNLLYDSVGSHLAESIMRYAPKKEFRKLHKTFFKGRMGSLARNETAAFVVQRVLEKLHREDLKEAVEDILPQVAGLIERSRVAVIKTLIDSCAKQGVEADNIAKAIASSYNCSSSELIFKMLKFSPEELEPKEGAKEEANGKVKRDPTQLHGSLLAQSMLQLPGEFFDMIHESLLSQTPSTLAALSEHTLGSHVIQAAISSNQATIPSKRKILNLLKDSFARLALSSSGSHIVDACWPATQGMMNYKQGIAEELLRAERELREGFFGRAVWRNWSMDKYKTRRNEWFILAKGDINSTTTDTVGANGNKRPEKKKTPLELARERHAAAKKSGGSPATGPNSKRPRDNTEGTANVNVTNGAKRNSQVLPYIASADSPDGKLIVEPLPPRALSDVFDLDLPAGEGRGKDGLEAVLEKVLRYSVNTWNPGFMDKLYASTDPIGIASELVLAVLNTNVVSPALTIIEKETTRRVANLFGFDGPYAGGMTLPGGSASNSTSMIIAKNTLFPETKAKGNGCFRFAVFTSTHGHYSVEKAAIFCGFGTESVFQIPVDKEGRMIPSELEAAVIKAKAEGYTPFYVNAGAGTTVFGSYDPFEEIADICQRHDLWFHVDGSWGGAVAFSDNLRWKLKGVEKADSVTMNPHKMLNVPVTCSFLLTGDRRKFSAATSLKAGYLFHEAHDGEDEVFDLAQMTMGCGRRADSMKLAFGWIYYGREGYQRRVDHAFEMASYFADALSKKNFHLVSQNPPPCLQVCFYYTPAGVLSDSADKNTRITRAIAADLIRKGFMIDYSPDPTKGEFFRAVVNSRTQKETVDALIRAIEEFGDAGL